MPARRPDATILIPQHGQAELTVACIASLRRHERTLWPIVVVDDGSPRSARVRVEQAKFPATKVATQNHRGVTTAWNRGAGIANTPYLLFLNNDVLCDGPAIDALLGPLRTGRARLSGIVLREETAPPEFVLRRLPTRTLLAGWCFAVAHADFDLLDGFDEHMTLYFSDTDFQLRLLASHGVDASAIVANRRLPLRHLGHRSTRRHPDRRAIWKADRDTFVRKWSAP